MVISFTIAAPYRGAAPRGRPHPLPRTPPPRSDTASRISFKELSGTPVISDPAARQGRGDSAPLPQAPPARTSSGTRSIAKTLTSRPHISDPFCAGGPLPDPYARSVTQSRILEIEGEYSLTFDGGDLPADAAVSSTGQEPNGCFWEGSVRRGSAAPLYSGRPRMPI